MAFAPECRPTYIHAWQENGSILVAQGSAAGRELEQRQALLAAAGVDATFLSVEQLRAAEPALNSARGLIGLYVATDVQLVRFIRLLIGVN